MATPTPPPTGYTIGMLEGAAVAALGAFATTFAMTMNPITSLVAAGGAAASFLGYSSYQAVTH